jgi:uncharacterized protein YdhG (YjbR/CyaY superfamily)
MNKKARNVDEYILNQPVEVREQLHTLRAVIQTVAPDAEEKISYGMPAYMYNGQLVYWGAFRNHYSLFGATGSLTTIFKKELKNFVVSKGTIQFPYDKKLPVALVKKLIKFRMKENEEKQKSKKTVKHGVTQKKKSVNFSLGFPVF